MHDRRGTGESEGDYVKTTVVSAIEDRIVPTDESVRNINRYMEISGNKNCNIAIIPRMGHVPVDIETRRRIDFDHLIINWLNRNVLTD